MMGIAKELQRRGHATAFATNRFFESVLLHAGLERIPRTELDGASFQTELWFEPLAVGIQVKHVEYALRVFEPDVIVGHQLTLGPTLVSERWNIPLAVLGFSCYLWPSMHLLHREPTTDSERRAIWRFNGVSENYTSLRKMYGLPVRQTSFIDTPMLGDVFLVQSVLELQRDIDALPSTVHLTGACLWEPAHDDSELTEWIREAKNADAPIIYAQQGRVFEFQRFWPALVEALKDTRIRVVASTSRMDGDYGSIPENFFVRPHVPQRAVLPHARLVICTGNSAAVQGSLTYGVPMLLAPAGGEQLEVAEQCAAAGVARVIPANDVTTDGLRRAVEEIFEDGSYCEHCVRLREAFGRHDACGKAAELCELLASTRRPVLRNGGFVCGTGKSLLSC
jgi:MGT family glycosyltransferase